MVDKMSQFISDDSKEKLILEVEKFPCLYDSSRGAYHIKQARSDAWAQVAANCGLPGKEVQCKVAWKRLKEKFKREREKLSNARSGDAATQVRTWCLYQTISFIEPFYQSRITSTNLEAPQTTFSEVQDVNDAGSELSPAMSPEDSSMLCGEEHDNFELHLENAEFAASSPFSVAAYHETPSPHADGLPRKRRKKFVQRNANRDYGSADRIVMVATNKAHTDPVSMFYESMAQEAKKLPRRKRQELQLKIMELTFQYCEDEE